MITTTELVAYLNRLLSVDLFRDYAPNGLQVAGKNQIQSIVTGVSACQALLDVAVERKADAVLVHHGYFWRGENPCIVGIQRSRIATLLQHDINLFAYHLPLDAHAELGNNIQLARLLGLEVTSEFSGGESPALGRVGCLAQPITGAAFAQRIQTALRRDAFYIPGKAETILTVAWCTGAAQDFIEAAAQQGVDAFVTGEVSERTVALARELGIHFYAAGHHATERYGILALGEHLASHFGLLCEYVDIDNPI